MGTDCGLCVSNIVSCFDAERDHDVPPADWGPPRLRTRERPRMTAAAARWPPDDLFALEMFALLGLPWEWLLLRLFTTCGLRPRDWERPRAAVAGWR